jgi:hypothetical protein
MDQVRNTYNMVHACEVANKAEMAIGLRWASDFNELFEAAVKKECRHNSEVEEDQMESPSGSVLVIEVGSESIMEVGSASSSVSVNKIASGSVMDVGSGSGPSKQSGREIEGVEGLQQWMHKQLREAWSQGAHKWTWGFDLMDEDLATLVWGTDNDLSYGSILSVISEECNPDALDNLDDEELHFDELSEWMEIPELCFPEHTLIFILLDPNGNRMPESGPDPVSEAFAKRARAATKVRKLIMQDEVNQPKLFSNSGFDPQVAVFIQ